MRVASTDPQTRQVVKQYASIRQAALDGYSRSRIHACIRGTARTHKSLGWRRIDGLHGLDLWLAAHVRPREGASVSWNAIVLAFTRSLPADERRFDGWGFDAALVRIGWSPRPRSGPLLGYEWVPKDERPP